MSDKAHFSLNGEVNKRNCLFYATENSQLIEASLRSKIWCSIWPNFFEDEDAATVNGERYRAIIMDFLIPIVRENDMDDYWFQQDGATCSSNDQFIAIIVPWATDIENGDFDWPSRSPALTPYAPKHASTWLKTPKIRAHLVNKA